jgi:transforming growth factor-beta-induced protein
MEITMKQKTTSSKAFKSILTTAAITSSLFLVACSDSDDSTGPSEGMSSETQISSSTDTGNMGQSIVDIAVGNSDFETLTAALTAADLVSTLEGEGPFTVFAPTDDAFAALPEGTLDALLADPSGDLKDILLYHVVSGAVKAETVVTLDKASTVGGSDVTIEVIDGKVILNGSVEVVSTDIEASNGVIHVIDAVLLPPAEEAPVEMAKSIVEIASTNADFETLTAALTAADLVSTLEGEGPFTVFAPTDDAFAALPEGTLDALLADPSGDLKDILLYHVVSGEVKAETVVTLDKATTVGSSDVTIEVVDGKVMLNGLVEVTATDIEASNGVIHVIDAVLLP